MDTTIDQLGLKAQWMAVIFWLFLNTMGMLYYTVDNKLEAGRGNHHFLSQLL